MTGTQATAHVFLTAFKAMPKAEREAFLAMLTEDESVREDLIDLALIAERQGEPSRPFSEFLAEREEQ
jgi:hypothetical protein